MYLDISQHYAQLKKKNNTVSQVRTSQDNDWPRLNTHALFEALVKSNGGSLLMEKASQARGSWSCVFG